MRAVALIWVMAIALIVGWTSAATASDDWLKAVQTGDRITLQGYVPDEQTRDRLANRPDIDATEVVLATGFPAGFADAVEFGLDLLGRLEDGQFRLDGTIGTLRGTTASVKVLESLREALRTGQPDGFAIVLSAVTVSERTGMAESETREATEVTEEPAAIAAYTWAADRDPEGEFSFTGYVPHENLQQFLHIRAGDVASDETEISEDAPENFVSSAVAAVTALRKIDSGQVAFDGDTWTFTGQAESDDARQSALAVLETIGADTGNWQISIDIAAPAPDSGFGWMARKTADGGIMLSGDAPSQWFMNHLGEISDLSGAQDLTVRDGAPAGFASDVLAGLDALRALESGELDYSDIAGWYLVGEIAGPSVNEAIEETLGRAVTPLDRWLLNLSAPAPVEMASAPEPEMDDTPPETTETAPASDETEIEVANLPEEPTTEPEPVVNPDYRFTAVLLESGTIMLSGDVPAEATARYLGVIAGGDVVNGLAPRENPPSDFLATATGAVRLLRRLENGVLSLRADGWSLSGAIQTDRRRDELIAEIEALPATSGWTFDIEAPSAFDFCRDAADRLTADNAILFGAGSTSMTPDSLPLLDALSEVLAECPDATIEVEGHTDSDGPDTNNMALSVARAESVVDRLIADGIDPARLYAIGYGESLPVASNDTTAGKRQNRRIVISVVREHI